MPSTNHPPPLESHPACFALLDDHEADATQPRSRLYTGYVRTLACDASSGLEALLQAMQHALQQGLHAVGLFSYELGAGLAAIPARSDAAEGAQILLFAHCAQLSAQQVDAWLAQPRPGHAAPEQGVSPGEPAGIAGLRRNVDDAAFHAAIACIQAYIETGDAYQINYTYRLRFDAYGPPRALYRRLRARQPVPYGALIALPDGGAVLSLSPELLIQHAQGRAVARPMKGTAPASGHPAEDQVRAAALSADIKNRAENVMITDLLRNDLSQIAQTGSVTVARLFEVARHGQVLQMTSTVEARLREDLSLLDVMAAVFPCGSITGAPKRRALQIIRALEPEARGLYTGAIGWFEAPSMPHTLGDFCLSVPIRTLVLQPPSADGLRAGVMGVGAGIVHDSRAADEYAECQTKAAFLTDMGHDFELFETMHASQGEGCRHRARHLARLSASAAYFGFGFDENEIIAALEKACAAMLPQQAYRLRLALEPSGEIAVQTASLQPVAATVRVLRASEPTDARDLFLRHKTTVRAVYDKAWRTAEAHGAFDMLFFNASGELTEGGRSNVFLKIAGRWFTPPLACGVLPGVMRSVLLDDPAWDVAERRLTREDLLSAEAIVLCNSLRGVLAASLG